MKKIAVVILNWNGSSHLKQFLPSVIEHTNAALCDVIVADNGSTDDSLELLEREFPSVEVIALPKNYGFAEGYNRALEDIRSPYTLLLNSDVEVSAGWIEPLYELLESDSEIGAAMPKIRAYANREYFEHAGAAGGFIDSFGYPFCRGRIMECVERDYGQYDTTRDVFWATGAALMIRTELYRRAGGLDQDFFAHMEEIDLCWRLQMMGYRIVVEPRSVVYHLGGGTLSVESPRKTYLNFRNNLAMLHKNLTTATFMPVLFSRKVLDGMSAMVYLLQGKRELFDAVWQAHMDYYKMLPDLRRKRRQVKKLRRHPVRNIYRGSIVLRFFMGGRQFNKMM